MKPADLAFKTILEIDDSSENCWVITFTDGSSVRLETVPIWNGFYGIQLEETL